MHYEWLRFKSEFRDWMSPLDVLLSPVCSFVAPPHGEGLASERFLGYLDAFLHNVTGHPAMTVRCGTSRDAMPIGVQISTHPMRENVALSVAEALEACFSGYQPPPNIDELPCFS